MLQPFFRIHRRVRGKRGSVEQTLLISRKRGLIGGTMNRDTYSTRLTRKEVCEAHRFGSDPYSREELVAEMGAAFLCGTCGIDTTTLEQSAAYINSWLARLKRDRTLVVQAAFAAQKAADFILKVQAGEETAGIEKAEARS